MKTKRFVVQVHAHTLVRYTGEVIVEAPEDMCEDCICEMIRVTANELPDPKWVGSDRNGRNTIYTDDSDESPEIVGVASSDTEPVVRLREDEDGNIRILIRMGDG